MGTSVLSTDREGRACAFQEIPDNICKKYEKKLQSHIKILEKRGYSVVNGNVMEWDIINRDRKEDRKRDLKANPHF
jgi:hypothetical protein